MKNKAKINIIGAFLLGASTLVTDAQAQTVVGPDTPMGAAPEATADGAPETAAEGAPVAAAPERPAETTRETCMADLENPDVLKESMINGRAGQDFIRVAIGKILDEEATEANNGEPVYEFTGCVYQQYGSDPVSVQRSYDITVTREMNSLLRLEGIYPGKHEEMCARYGDNPNAVECVSPAPLPINQPRP